MEIWKAIIVGIVQGLAEFLPVSSSGHIVLAQYLLGIRDVGAEHRPDLSFEIVHNHRQVDALADQRCALSQKWFHFSTTR